MFTLCDDLTIFLKLRHCKVLTWLFVPQFCYYSSFLVWVHGYNLEVLCSLNPSKTKITIVSSVLRWAIKIRQSTLQKTAIVAKLWNKKSCSHFKKMSKTHVHNLRQFDKFSKDFFLSNHRKVWTWVLLKC